MVIDVNKKEKREKKLNLYIKKLTILILIMFVYFLTKLNYVDKSITYLSIEAMKTIGYIDIILSVITVIICWIYNRQSNNINLFIISLFYMSLSTELIYKMWLYSNNPINTKIIDNITITLIIVRMIILSFFIYEKHNKLNFSKKIKILLISIICLTTKVLIDFEVKVNFPSKNNYIYIIIIITVFLSYFIILVILAYKSLLKNKFLYMIIVGSVSLILLRNIYGYNYIFNYILNGYSNLFILLSLLFFIIGLSLEALERIHYSEDLERQLKLFYTIIEEDSIDNVAIYDEYKDIIYVNKAALISANIDLNLSKKEQYEAFGKIIEEKEVFQKYKKIISSSTSINKKWTGTVEVEKNNKYYKVNVKKLKYDESDKFIVNYRNITKEHKMHEKLKINELKLRTMTGNIKDLVCSTDLEGNIIYANPAFEELLGYNENRLLGKNWFDLVADKDLKKILNLINFNQKDSIALEHKLKKKDKSTIFVESVWSKVKNSQDEFIGKVIVSRHIDYRKEVETLKNQFEKMKEYERIRGEFFANLSHELRTPINIIYSCLQLLELKKNINEDKFSDAYEKYECTIKQNCFRMLRLVNNLIDITKIDSGFLKVDFINCDIIKVIEDITMSIIPYVDSKKLDIIFDTNVEENIIRCDPEKIERIMLNILSNSVKFTENGGKIFVNIIKGDKVVKIKIRDTGVGVPIELRNMIFERFVQVDKSLNRAKEGSGIGLAIVKSLVELQGGKIYLNDEIENGSEFIIELPNIRDNEETKFSDTNFDNIYKVNDDRILIEFADIYDLN